MIPERLLDNNGGGVIVNDSRQGDGIGLAVLDGSDKLQTLEMKISLDDMMVLGLTVPEQMIFFLLDRLA